MPHLITVGCLAIFSDVCKISNKSGDRIPKHIHVLLLVQWCCCLYSVSLDLWNLNCHSRCFQVGSPSRKSTDIVSKDWRIRPVKHKESSVGFVSSYKCMLWLH